MNIHLQANPKLNKILWKRDGFPVVPAKNLLMSGMNLVLQGVHRGGAHNFAQISNCIV